jgi:hypothetical protein
VDPVRSRASTKAAHSKAVTRITNSLVEARSLLKAAAKEDKEQARKKVANLQKKLDKAEVKKATYSKWCEQNPLATAASHDARVEMGRVAHW